MPQPKDPSIVDLDIQDILNSTVKQRLRLLASLIVDKRIEDEKNGSPLYKRIQAEAAEITKEKSVSSK